MTKYEQAVLTAAMDVAAAQHALDLGTPAQVHLKRAYAVLMDVCGDLAGDHDGEWSPALNDDLLNRAGIRLALALNEMTRLRNGSGLVDRLADTKDERLIEELQAACGGFVYE